MNISEEGAAKVGEIVNNLQSLSIDSDGRLDVIFTGCWLKHHFRFLCTNGKAKSIAGRWQLVHALLHLRFRACI